MKMLRRLGKKKSKKYDMAEANCPSASPEMDHLEGNKHLGSPVYDSGTLKKQTPSSVQQCIPNPVYMDPVDVITSNDTAADGYSVPYGSSSLEVLGRDSKSDESALSDTMSKPIAVLSSSATVVDGNIVEPRTVVNMYCTERSTPDSLAQEGTCKSPEGKQLPWCSVEKKTDSEKMDMKPARVKGTGEQSPQSYSIASSLSQFDQSSKCLQAEDAMPQCGTNVLYELMESPCRTLLDEEGYSVIPNEDSEQVVMCRAVETNWSSVQVASVSQPTVAVDEDYSTPWSRERTELQLHQKLEEAVSTKHQVAPETVDVPVASSMDNPPLSPSASAHQELLKIPWYHGHLTRDVAERLLHQRNTGTFLIRINDGKNTPFTLSFRTDEGVVHMHITRTEDDKLVLGSRKHSRPFNTLEEMISTYQKKQLPAKGFAPICLKDHVECIRREK